MQSTLGYKEEKGCGSFIACILLETGVDGHSPPFVSIIMDILLGRAVRSGNDKKELEVTTLEVKAGYGGGQASM